jgi:heme exporter protein CcmD
MSAFGPHGSYIVASYAVAFLVIGWMIAASLLSYRQGARRLAALEAAQHKTSTAKISS